MGGIPAGFVCDRCSRCCRSHRVPITKGDAARLLQSNRVHPERQFIELVSVTEVDLVGEPESVAVVREGKGLLVLSHVQDAQGSRCVFLSEQGCEAHEARPSACRAYPFERPTDVNKRSLGLHPDLMCPPETGYERTSNSDAACDLLAAEYERAVTLRNEEASEHALLMQSWNKQQRARLRLGRLPKTARELVSWFLEQKPPPE